MLHIYIYIYIYDISSLRVKVVYKEIPPHISIVWVNEKILMLKYVVDIITTLL